MSFGKRVVASAPVKTSAAPASPERDALVAELRAMARKSGASAPKVYGTVNGRLVNEDNPVLASRDDVVDARDVRRSDYWASNILGNLSAVIGVAGGVALGFSPQGVIGCMFILWGLTAVATGRMMKSNEHSSRVFMGNAARLAGLGVIAAGAWFIYQGWNEPALIGYFLPGYEAPMGGLFGKR